MTILRRYVDDSRPTLSGGDETAIVSMPARELEAYFGSPLSGKPWDCRPLDVQAIKRLFQHGQGLAPRAGSMGHELLHASEHEARIAWLMGCGGDSLDPVTVSLGFSYDEGYMDLLDGNHRLSAALLLDRWLDIEVVAGTTRVLDSFAGNGGVMLRRPRRHIFGRNVIPCMKSDRFIHIDSYPGRVVINDLDDHTMIADLGPMVWRVGDPFSDSRPTTMLVTQAPNRDCYIDAFVEALVQQFGLSRQASPLVVDGAAFALKSPA